MRNLTSLFGLDVRYSYHRMGAKILVARWDWDEVYGGIVQCPNPDCGQRDKPFWKNGTGLARKRNIKDRPVGGAPLEIDLQCQRYKCPKCYTSFGSTHPGIKRNSNLTIRLIHHLALRARGPETQAQIARRTGVAASTVRHYFRKHLLPPEDMPDHPEAIGVDGAHVGTGVTVVTGLGGDKNHVLNVLKDQNKDTLRRHLNDLEPAQKPLPVVIDMSTTFKAALQDCRLPIAVVIDRYHVSRRANLALGHCRNELVGGSDVEDDWDDRKQEIYNRAQASDGKQLRIEGTGTKELDQMAQAFKAALWFQWIMTAEISREEADEELAKWKSYIEAPPVREHFENDVFGTVENWRDEILNYYDYRYTNGFNEGINNLVKKLDRIGASYSRETLQAKLRHNQAHRGTFNNVMGSISPGAMGGTVAFKYYDGAGTRRVNIWRAVEMPGSLAPSAPPEEIQKVKDTRY